MINPGEHDTTRSYLGHLATLERCEARARRAYGHRPDLESRVSYHVSPSWSKVGARQFFVHCEHYFVVTRLDDRAEGLLFQCPSLYHLAPSSAFLLKIHTGANSMLRYGDGANITSQSSLLIEYLLV